MELENMKKEITTKKRRIKSSAPSRRKHVIQEYVLAKDRYEEEAKNAQTKSWKEICSKQDRESLWVGIYRILKNTSKRTDDKPKVKDGRTLNPTDSVKLITSTFFPDNNANEDTPEHTLVRKLATEVEGKDEDNDPPFTAMELENSLRTFNPKKAPGLDGFTADICVAAICSDPGLFLSIINRCLRLAYFIQLWKTAATVVLKNPGKVDYNNPKSYWPIGLLPVLGKIFEKMLMERIKWHILPQLNPRQYGFVPQRCTEDALYDLINYIKEKIKEKKVVVLISLDIQGAFGSAWWPAILQQLNQKIARATCGVW
ncbi:jg7109 [Pararge aegeria aegeria]|uniref:Jg7109 protein n=1 Tax=Pararge aegeria aegeria TaxID=348720 RepID=A0A8S4QLF9_9NEOP|nr:jg7109 [Pararge aegeria aegeria]